VKLSLALIILLALVIVLFIARRRLWLALKLTAAAFVALNVYRFIGAAEDTESFVTLGVTLAAFGLAWLLLWGVTRLVERHRSLHPPQPKPLQRRPRWKL
jgi:hypothetical protein